MERRPDVLVCIGDWYDFHALSRYDMGTAKAEGARLTDDLAAGNAAWARLNAPLEALQAKQRAQKMKVYDPERHFFLGNHEYRLVRAANDQPHLTGLLGYDMLELRGWTVHAYLRPHFVHGIAYAHYFYNPLSGRPLGGTAENKLKQIGHSATMGHQQVLQYHQRIVAGRPQHMLVAGAAYLHREEYLGEQGEHPRGIVVKHNVQDGDYDLEWVSMDRLCRKYEGVSLAAFLA